MFNTIGFIGTGTMGAAVARAVVKGAPGASILLSNRTPAKAEALAKGLGVQASDNETVARTCSLIFLGVKPQMMAGMLESISPILAARSDRFVLASMAAGLDAQRIQAMAGGKYPVICFMPNTPVAVGAGVVQYYGLGTAQEELDAIRRDAEAEMDEAVKFADASPYPDPATVLDDMYVTDNERCVAR